MNGKILEAVKALGGDLENTFCYRGGEKLLALCDDGDYLCVGGLNGILSDATYICTIPEFNTYASEWLKEAYMHNAAIDLGWDVANTRDSKYIFQYQRGRDPVIIVIAKSVNDLMNDEYTMLCTKQEFIDYCEANKTKSAPVFTQAMADAGELPPVGAECMTKSGSLDDWFKGKCIGYDGDFAVFIMGDEYPFKCRYAGFEAHRVKPIKSPRDKAIDSMRTALTSTPIPKEISVKVYDWLKQLTPEQRKEFDL